MNAVIKTTRRFRRYLVTGEVFEDEKTVIEVAASEITRIANCRTLAAEANAEKLFAGQIDWVLVSLVCRELLEPAK